MRLQLVSVLLQVPLDEGRAPGCYRGGMRRRKGRRTGGSSCDLDALIARPRGGGRQEAQHRPSDPLWWPILSPRCLTGRKDAVCCPPAPLTCSPLLVPTGENTLLIPDSSLALPCSFVLLPSPSLKILLFVPCRLSASSFSSPCCQHPLRPIAASLLLSLLFYFFGEDVNKHC